MSHPLRSGAIVLVLAALAQLPLTAQQPPIRKARKEGPPVPERALAEDGGAPSTIDLEFKGGSVQDYIRLIGEKLPGLNIVLDDNVAMSELPAMQLKRVAVKTAIDLVTQLATTGSGISIDCQVLIDEEGGGGDPVWVLKFQLHDSPPGRPVALMPGMTTIAAAPAQTTQIFSLRELIEGIPGDPPLKLKPETVLSAIQEALTDPRTPSNEQAVAKFHPESNLLIVRGNPAQIAVVKQVVESLPGTPERRKDRQAEGALKEKEARLEQLQAEGAKVRDEMEMYRSKVRALEREVDELSKVADLIRNEKADLQKRYNDLAARAGQGTGSTPAEGGKP